MFRFKIILSCEQEVKGLSPGPRELCIPLKLFYVILIKNTNKTERAIKILFYKHIRRFSISILLWLGSVFVLC